MKKNFLIGVVAGVAVLVVAGMIWVVAGIFPRRLYADGSVRQVPRSEFGAQLTALNKEREKFHLAPLSNVP